MRFLFGEYALDAATHELTRGGKAVPVEPQVFDLIVFLIENRERVVSREDIIDAVWAGRIVSDSAISSRIKTARQALGDNGRTQTVIKTVHGKGFRFIAKVRELADAETGVGDLADTASPAASPGAISAYASPRRLLGPVLFTAASLVIAAALLFFFTGRSPLPKADETRIAILPIANATGADEYDWVELGLMSLAAHTLETRSGRSTVSPRAVLSAAPDWTAPAAGEFALDEDVLTRLRSAYGASHVVAARLLGADGRLSLEFQIFSPRGAAAVRSLSGEDPSALANRMTREIMAALPRSGELPVSGEDITEDPFIAEAYARARALQLQGKAAESRDLFKVAADQEPENIWLRYEYALSSRMAGEEEESARILEALLPEAIDKADRKAELAILNGMGRIHARRNEHEAAIAAYARALDVAEATKDDKSLGIVLTNLGIQERQRRNYAQAEMHLGRALTAFDTAGYEEPPGHLLNSLALLKIETGDLVAGADYLDRALTSFELIGAERSVAAVLRNLADVSERLGRWDEADARYERSLTMRRTLEDRRGELSSLDGLAGLRLKQGRFDDASDMSNALRQLAEREGSTSRLAKAHQYLGDIAFRRGDLDGAAAELQKASAGYRDLENQAALKGIEARLLVIEHHSNPATGHITDMQGIVEWAASDAQDALAKDANERLANMLLSDGQAEPAKDALEAAVDAARSIPDPAEVGRLSARLGRLSLDTNDADRASGLLGIAREQHPGHFQTLLLKAEIARASGREEEAERAFHAARDAAGDNWPPAETP